MTQKNLVQPPFTHPSHFFGFLIVAVGLLVLPWLNHQFFPMAPESIWSAVSLRYGAYGYISEEMAKTEPIDILFVGASDTWTGIDPLILQEVIAKESGLHLNIVNFGSNWRGEELYFSWINDVLKKRRVTLILYGDTRSSYEIPHEVAYYFWRYPEHFKMVKSLPLQEKRALYGESVLGGLHVTLSQLRPHNRYGYTVAITSREDELRNGHGVNKEKLGWKSHLSPPDTVRPEFEPIKSAAPQLAANDMIYRGKPHKNFGFVEYAYTDYQSLFIRNSYQTAVRHGTSFVMLALPLEFSEPTRPTTAMRRFDKGPQTFMTLGVPPRQLFAGMDEKMRQKFHTNESHLNANGAELYSAAIAPGVLQLYKEAVSQQQKGGK